MKNIPSSEVDSSFRHGGTSCVSAMRTIIGKLRSRSVSILFSVMLCVGFAPAASAVPVILNSTESASPGDSIFVQGEGFGSGAQVWFRRVLPTDTTLSPTTQLTVLNTSTAAVTASLPKTMPMGLYAVWVKDSGGNYSAPVFVNRARAMKVEYDEVSPSYAFRIFGRNLCLPGATPTVTFVNGGTSLAATVVTAYSNDRYELKVQAPAGISTGTTYTIKVSNGHGHNATANFDVTTADFTLDGRAGGSDPFNLGVPWGADYAAIAANVIDVTQSPYFADNTGATNTLSALQAALADAGNPSLNPNGATVYLPAGTYLINMPTSTGLNIKSKVVMLGDGIGQTIISDTSTRLGSYAITVGSGGVDASLSGIKGLTYRHDMTVTTDGQPNSFRNFSNGSSKVFFSDIYFDMKFAILDTGNKETSKITIGVVLPQSANNTNVLVQNCTFKQCRWGNPNDPKPNTFGHGYIIRNNSFLSWYARLSLMFIDNLLVEGNELVRDGLVPHASFPYPAKFGGLTGGGLEFSGKDITVLRNAFSAINLPLAVHNDGESMLNQNLIKDAEYDFASPTSVTSTTLTNSSRSWATNFYAGKMIAIIKGPGTGQVRIIASNTGTTVTLNESWEVQPTTASTYCLTVPGAYRYLIKDNSLASLPRGIGMYCGSYDCAYIGNFLADTSWSVYMRGDHRIDPLATVGDVPRFRVAVVNRNIMTDNTAVNTTDTWSAFVGAHLTMAYKHSLIGTPVIGNTFRRNLVEASAGTPDITDYAVGIKEGHANFASDDNTAGTFVDTNTAAVLVSTFDDNVAVNADNAYYMNTHSYQTVIRNHLGLNTTNLLSDATLPGATHGSVNTYTADDPVVLEANFSGTGTSTGGATDMVSFGGSGVLAAGAGGNSVAINSANPFTGSSGSYVTFSRVPSGTLAARLKVTAMEAHTGWGRIFDNRSGQWLVNGAYDFFWRPQQTPSAAGSMRPIDFSNGSDGVRMTFYSFNTTTLKSEIITGSGGGGVTLTGTYGSGFASGQIYHLGVTFSTNPLTGVTTMKMFAVAGTGAIDTTSATNLIGSTTFTLNPTIATDSGGWLEVEEWKLGDAPGVTTTTVNDYDRLRLYYRDPGTFPAL